MREHRSGPRPHVPPQEASRMADAIARLLREDPTVTAQAVADKLSYSEPKALRYQLNRIGFKNFSEFRSAVLSGAYVPSSAAAEEELAAPHDMGTLPLAIPVATRITTAGQPLFGESDASRQAAANAPALSGRAFAVAWRGETYDTYLRPGAYLIVDPAHGPRSGELWLAITPQHGLSLWRRYRVQDTWLLVHPVRPEVTVGPHDLAKVRHVGPVVWVVAPP